MAKNKTITWTIPMESELDKKELFKGIEEALKTMTTISLRSLVNTDRTFTFEVKIEYLGKQIHLDKLSKIKKKVRYT